MTYNEKLIDMIPDASDVSEKVANTFLLYDLMIFLLCVFLWLYCRMQTIGPSGNVMCGLFFSEDLILRSVIHHFS